ERPRRAPSYECFGLGHAKHDREVVSDPLERSDLDAVRPLRVEQDQRVLDRLQRVLDSEATVVGDGREGEQPPVADASAYPGRCAGRESGAPSVGVEKHGTRIAVHPRLPPDRFRSLEGLAERCSSPGCDGRSLARTQGASIAEAIGATEDAASGRAARPGGTDTVS